MDILNDFNTSVEKALDEIDGGWREYSGLIICGTHSPHDTEYMIDKIREARKENKPALLICMGHQLGAIQWARDNGIPDATSEEIGSGTWVVKKRPELKIGLHEGESWWSNYEVVIDWEIPNNWVSVPYHPEYNSSNIHHHPLLVKFIEYCKEYGKI